MAIQENQWFQSTTTKRLFVIKAIFGKGTGADYKKHEVVLLEAFKESEIIHQYDDFKELINKNQLEKIS